MDKKQELTKDDTNSGRDRRILFTVWKTSTFCSILSRSMTITEAMIVPLLSAPSLKHE